ncbi:MAG: hypothetical protein IT353_08955 [Gemmatimonadaceae bacterium]|nr:hypothetical protein [Gemmatimonadaceae bacterium]
MIIDRYVFAAGSEVFCCWDHDLATRNMRFLTSVDGQYFSYVAECHAAQLDGSDRQRAAIALRAAYHHGLESMFSLLGAFVQAPGAVPAWLPKCSNPALRELVEGFQIGSTVMTQAGPQQVLLSEIAEHVHGFCWPDDQPTNATKNRFGRLWSRFAYDFLNPLYYGEYNSIKHGLRVGVGGFVLRVGLEEEYGVPAPEENMQTLGGSAYGTSFFQATEITGGLPKHHFQIRSQALNWRPEAMVQRLQLIAFSINNIVSALRCINGVNPATVQFHRPEDPEAFEAAWRWHVGVESSSFDLTLEAANVDPASRAALQSELNSRTAHASTPQNAP